MSIYRCAPCLRYGWGVLFALGLIGINPFPGMAQITPDDTLGNERSRVNRNVQIRGRNVDRIEGGATRGSNLFHSFQEFNVNEGQRVYFANPSGIANILSRVTGRDVSDIMGTLGVEGGANLFLLNPNGIIFGPNAQLDISGSFFSSTADSFTFPDGTQFSATNPRDSSLLSVNVPLGVQYGPNAPGAITNAGTLSVGQNFRLSGGSVTSTGLLSVPSGQLLVEGVAGNVQIRNAVAQTATLSASNNLFLQDSQLQTTNDLNLFAGNTVQVRDSVANPFVAYAGGNLTIQGNQNIDIFALNHPSSGLVSGGDMVLRSANTVGGDAHYWTGGNFRIEQLDGDLGNLFSPYDPVIRSSGDVSFDSYRGASLHIFAGGSVIIDGTVTITGADETVGIVDSVTLSDGMPVDINGAVIPTLDIRAGTSNNINPPENEGDLSGFSPTPPTTNTPPRGANISISGTVEFDADAGGIVLLTNQDQIRDPNVAGNITITDIDTGGEEGGGDVYIDSRGEITINGTIVTSSFDEDLAGDVTLRAVNDITLNPGSRIDGNTYDSVFYPTISIRSTAGSVFLNGATITAENDSDDDTSFGLAGDIVIDAAQQISLINSTISASGDYGRIVIGSDNVSNPDSDQSSPETLSVLNSRITTENNSEDSSATAGDIYLRANSVSIDLDDIDLDEEEPEISASTSGAGIGGSVTIHAPESVTITGSGEVNAETSGTGDAGSINITTPILNVNEGAELSTTTSGDGNAGTITINASREISLDGGDIFSLSGINSTGRSGTISLSTARLSLRNGANISVRTSGSGEGGAISIFANQLDLSKSTPSDPLISARTSGSGIGGDISLEPYDNGRSITINFIGGTNDGFISAATIGDDNGGDVTIRAPESVTITGSGEVNAETGGTGDAGNVNITTPILNVDEGATVSTRATGTGAAGDLTIRAGQVVIEDDASISASNVSSQTSGNISLEALDRLVVRDGGEITASTRTGQAGNITINEGVSLNENNEVIVRNGGRIAVSANANEGIAGDIIVNANQLRLINGEISASATSGRAGGITIDANDSVVIRNDGRIVVEANRDGGTAGDIVISTGQLRLNNGEISVQVTGNDGIAGDITINARNAVLRNNSAITAATASAERGGRGRIVLRRRQTSDGQDVNMRFLRVFDSEISAQTGRGQGGNLRISADRVRIDGDSVDHDNNSLERRLRAQGGLSVEATGREGSAGNLTLNARRVIVEDGARISASNDSSSNSNESTDNGNIRLRGLDTLVVSNGAEITASTRRGIAGNVIIDAEESIEVSRNSRLTVEATGGSNRNNLTTRERNEIEAGNLTIRTNNLSLQDGSEATVSSQGQAGDLTIAVNSIDLENSSLTAVSGSGDGGNITLTTETPLLLFDNLENQDVISARAFGDATGGNVELNIRDGFIATNEFDNTDIVANAEAGDGGRIEINTNQIFGFRERRNSPFSDLDASSESGAQGTITLNTLNVDPTRGLGELETEIVDVSNLVAEGCVGSDRRGVDTQGEFTRTGRGGLSPDPTDTLINESLFDQFSPANTVDRSSTTPSDSSETSQSLVEAQGLARNASGKVSLVPGSSNSSLTSPGFTSNTCDAP